MWADPWEKENLAGADFPVILNVNQWHSGRCVSPELVTGQPPWSVNLQPSPLGVPVQGEGHAWHTRDTSELCQIPGEPQPPSPAAPPIEGWGGPPGSKIQLVIDTSALS